MTWFSAASSWLVGTFVPWIFQRCWTEPASKLETSRLKEWGNSLKQLCWHRVFDKRSKWFSSTCFCRKNIALSSLCLRNLRLPGLEAELVTCNSVLSSETLTRDQCWDWDVFLRTQMQGFCCLQKTLEDVPQCYKYWNIYCIEMSYEKDLGWLGYMGDYTTLRCRNPY